MSIDDTLGLFYTCLRIILPTFGWVVLGVVVQRIGLLPQWLNDRISKLAFNFGLPVMLFAGAAMVDYSGLGAARYLLAGVSATLLTFVVSWLYSRWRGHPRRQQGIFVQTAFRSNLAIVGIALVVSAYGEGGTALAAMPVALLTVLYNILAVIVLDATLGSGSGMARMVGGVVRNPLIIGISLGALLSVSGLPVPAVLGTVSATLSAFFLPLMLICIGASMDLSRLYRADAMAWEASAWRLVVAPAIGVALAWVMGVRDEPLGVIFLLLATPVAVSSHVMVAAARGDGVLAANMIVLTTLLSVVTVTLGFFLLSMFSLVGTLQ